MVGLQMIKVGHLRCTTDK